MLKNFFPKDLEVNKKVRSGNDRKSNYAGIVLEILKRQRKFKSQSSGSVRVKLSIDGKGDLSEVKVLRSSGFPRDDKNARRFIKKAAPFPKPPNSNGITFEATWLKQRPAMEPYGVQASSPGAKYA